MENCGLQHANLLNIGNSSVTRAGIFMLYVYPSLGEYE